MIIENSNIHMSSKRSYFNYSSKESVTIVERAGDAAIKLEASEKGELDLMEQVREHEQKKQEQEKKQREENLKKQFEQMQEQNKTVKGNVVDARGSAFDEFHVKTKEEMELTMIKILMRSLGHKMNDKLPGLEELTGGKTKQSKSQGCTFSEFMRLQGMQIAAATPSMPGNKMVRTTVESVFECGSENTAFMAQGIANTKDGRSISFGLNVEMSRAFCNKYESFTQEEYIATDPLVINIDDNMVGLTDTKFFFDLDSDGKEEEISFAKKGSGFLALDKNNDGKINDGSELFGTKSGDGFADLSQYDKDHNGWIDEADEIFSKLKVWTKDEDGNDKLIDLKAANIGAIYLDNADTEFTLGDAMQRKQDGILRKTGIYLKENGGVGTMQHVDLIL